MTESTEEEAPGWDAIDKALAPLYRNQEPKHFGTVVSYRLGGPDPLEGISAYRRLTPLPHWHFVTYGFSELFEKESTDKEVSGYGFELTFRLKVIDDNEEPPRWPLNFLQNLARYVFQTGNVFRDGDWMNANGPIALGEPTQIRSMGFAADPELLAIDSPNGRLEFLQIVGLTQDEEGAAKRWQTRKVLDVFLPAMPLWITDLARHSLLEQADIARLISEGERKDGSSTGVVWTDVLAWREDKRLLRKPVMEVELGAAQVEEITALLPLRLPFGRTLLIGGPSQRLLLASGGQNARRVDGNTLHLDFTDPAIREMAANLPPRRGTYELAACPGLRFRILPTQIKDASGRLVQTIG